MNKIFTSFLCAAMLYAGSGYSQSQRKLTTPAGRTTARDVQQMGPWQLVPNDQAPSRQLMRINAQQYKVFRLNEAPLRVQLFSASYVPAEGTVVDLPMADGTFRAFRIWQTPMMSEEMQMKYPDIRTFTGEAVDDHRVTAKLDFTLFGFHAMIFGNKNTSFIDPYDNYRDGYYVVHFKKDELRTPEQQMHCGVKGDDAPTTKQKMELPGDKLPALNISKRTFEGLEGTSDKGSGSSGPAYAVITNGTKLRTYLIALSANNFYCQAATGLGSPTIPQCFSAMTTSMNRVNGVYNREFSVQMNFCNNEDTLIWPTATGSINGADPFNAINTNPNSCITTNQTVCDTRIGSANYDIGHVFTTGAGGLAMLGVVCNASLKAEGVTGSSTPVGDGYDIDYVAHEVGHEFGSNHTFNNNADGSCGGNAVSSCAYEPGSGATIMDYAGICSPDNTQAHSDPYFSGSSLQQITTKLNTTEAGCSDSSVSGNVPVTLAAFTASYNIPYKTPFELTGPTATLGAADTAVTYNWYQWNLGDFGARLNNTYVSGPIFRSFQPAYTPTRIFPVIDSILKGVLTYVNTDLKKGEKVPDTARYLTFKMAVRAIMNGNGALKITDDSIHLNAISTGAANGYAGFKVTSQGTTGIVYSGNTNQTVTWNVVGTNAAPVNATNVDIYMSTDGGYTWPYTLGSFPNNGSAIVTLPNPAVTTTTARIKVKGNGNVFFNINAKNFTVNPGVTTAPIIGTFTVCIGSTTTLADATTPGTWASSTPSVATIGTANGVVLGISAGTTTITYTAASGPVTAVVTVTAAPTAGTITGTASTCIAQATTLSHTTSGGAWTSSATGTATVAGGVVTGVAAGTAVISYTMTNACGTATATRTVTVNAPTVLSPITGTLTVCESANTTLSNTTPSGMWSSTATGTATVGITSGIVSGIAAGTSTISYTVTNAFGCVSSVTAVVTVNATPSVSITPSGVLAICTGATATMAASVGAGYSYQWHSGSTTIPGATNSTYTTTVAGTYDATITNTSGCSTTTTVVTVTVTPGLTVVPGVTIAASPGTTLCSSSTLVSFVPTLTNGGSSPILTWYVNGAPVATAPTYNYYPVNGDIVKVLLTSNAACAFPDTATAAVTMSVSPLVTPTVGVAAAPNDTVCSGSSVTFTPVPGFGGTTPTYIWRKNGTVVTTSAYYSYVPPVGQDTLTVTMTSSYPCVLTPTVNSSNFIVTALATATNAVSITASATTIAPGTAVTFNASSTYAGTYQWFVNGAAVSGATAASYTTSTLANGDVVTCVVTTGVVCVSPNPTKSNAITMAVRVNGVAEVGQLSGFTVSPNPNKGTFAITGNTTTEKLDICVMNLLGQTVYASTAQPANGQVSATIALGEAMANGVYLVKLISENGTAAFRVLIER